MLGLMSCRLLSHAHGPLPDLTALAVLLKAHTEAIAASTVFIINNVLRTIHENATLSVTRHALNSRQLARIDKSDSCYQSQEFNHSRIDTDISFFHRHKSILSVAGILFFFSYMRLVLPEHQASDLNAFARRTMVSRSLNGTMRRTSSAAIKLGVKAFDQETFLRSQVAWPVPLVLLLINE